MIKWIMVRTEKNYPFYAYRTKKGFGDIIILKDFYEANGQVGMSLTNAMDEVLEHIALGISFGTADLTGIRFYQYGEDGLFEVIPWWVKKITRDMPPFRLDKVEWKFISKDLKHFEVLYCD